MGSLIGYDSQTHGWKLLQALPAVAVSGGFDAWLALDSLGKIADNINFKTLAYRFSGDCPPKTISLDVKDMAPNLDQPAAVSRVVNSNLAAPRPLSPPNGATFDIFPRKTVLVWSAVPNATAYLIEVQYEDPTAETGWRPSVFRRLEETTLRVRLSSEPSRAAGESGLSTNTVWRARLFPGSRSSTSVSDAETGVSCPSLLFDVRPHGRCANSNRPLGCRTHFPGWYRFLVGIPL